MFRSSIIVVMLDNSEVISVAERSVVGDGLDWALGSLCELGSQLSLLVNDFIDTKHRE
jgi:hypothetical protein